VDVFQEKQVATFDVLLPVRNGLPFFGEAVDSIREQTFSDWRLLILDHGSSDGSFALAQKYEEEDARIKVFSFPQADGLASLLNLGIEKCDCRHILRQDADDVSLVNRMTIINDLFRNNANLLAVGSDALYINETGDEIGYLRFPTDPCGIAAAGFFYNPMLHPTIAANFVAFTQYGAMYARDILASAPRADSLVVRGLAEDYALFGQLALLGPCANLAVPLVKYRRHGGSVGASNAAQQLEMALRVSLFLARSFCSMKGLPGFDPRPFCNHAENVFDFHRLDYSHEFEQMAFALRRGLGPSGALERELAFRWVLTTRNSSLMFARYLYFQLKYGTRSNEWRTVRNWLLRTVRNGKYVYRAKGLLVDEGSNGAIG
jgi:glycosyltransferase involved in cell wall biosynthesis